MKRAFIYNILAVLLLMFGSSGVLHAQYEENDTARWNFNSTVSVRLNTGNIQRFLITPEANVAHIAKNKWWGFTARQRYTYGRFGKLWTENDLLSRNFIYLIPEKRIYPYWMAWFQTHEGQRLKFRYQVGPGVTFVALKKKQQVIKFSITATFEQNWYKAAGLTGFADSATANFNTWRATGRLYGTHNIVPKVLDLYYEILFQQSLVKIKDWRVFLESGINVRVIKGFSLRTFINYDYQTVHQIKVKPGDLVLNVGLSYKIASKN